MKIDSMILSMREKSIQKEKQKSDLKLYLEDEKKSTKKDSLQNKAQTSLQQSVEPQESAKFQKDMDSQVSVQSEMSTELQASAQPERNTEFQAQGNLSHGEEGYDTERLFELLELTINDLKADMGKEFRVRQPKEIYECNGLDGDMKNGIFMIDMYRNSLPPAMEEKIKKRSVMDILQAFEISIKDLERDGAQKQEALKKELKQLKERVKDAVSEKKSAIKKLEKNIAKIKAMIATLEEYQQAQMDMIKNEQIRIDNALKFIKRRKSSNKKPTQ